MIVVDASVVATALADDGDDGDEVRARLTGQALAAPELLALEVCQVIRHAARARRLSTRRAGQVLEALRDLPVAYAPHCALLRRVWELRDDATAYDAAYLALAELLDAPLVTADRRLGGVPGVSAAVQLVGDGRSSR